MAQGLAYVNNINYVWGRDHMIFFIKWDILRFKSALIVCFCHRNLKYSFCNKIIRALY